MKYVLQFFVPLSFFCALAISVRAADIIIADFEGKTYSAGWTTEGIAFGTGPAQGTLEGQMHVSGFLGKGLVNSYLGGDDTTGKLTSPKFKIEKPFISFLTGGGGHPGLEMNLIVDGKTVRKATGPNVVPGGSERLDWADWDVADLQGKEAFIEIIDNATGGWGHINVDNIIQTDRKHTPVEKRINITADKEFLHIPVSNSAPITWICIEVDGQWQMEIDCPLAVSGTPDFYGELSISQWKGKKITLIAEKVPVDSEGLALVKQSDKTAQEDTVYKEKYRPLFHFSPRYGWMNDPNGLVFYDGTYHLFFQHTPFIINGGNKTWGHATSTDLLHWTELPEALHADKLGSMWSGSAVVDWNNTSGFQTGKDKPIVLIYTAHGPSARFGAKVSQCIAYSTDGGKTFTKYEKNPVIPHIIGGNRDPKVIWHEPTKQWILALYFDQEDYALFGSKNLKQWDKICDIRNLGCSECPDFFPLAVDGNKDNTKWVFWGANGKYLIGSFDGMEFKPETKPLTVKYGGNDYAAQTFSDVPNGRRIQFSWMFGGQYPGMPFNQQFSIPRELTLRTTPDGVKLFTKPTKEAETLRGESINYAQSENSNAKTIYGFDFPLFDAEINMSVVGSAKLLFETAGRKIEYNAEEEKISLDGITAPLKLRDGKLRLRILVDRTSIELFAQDGEVQIAKCFVPADVPEQKGIVISVSGSITVEKATIWKMKSVW
jgi:fructan beta-fructosidase